MRPIPIPVLDAPLPPGAIVRDDAATLLVLHREVLETIRLTVDQCAHPSCASCHELARILDDYLLG